MNDDVTYFDSLILNPSTWLKIAKNKIPRQILLISFTHQNSIRLQLLTIGGLLADGERKLASICGYEVCVNSKTQFFKRF